MKPMKYRQYLLLLMTLMILFTSEVITYASAQSSTNYFINIDVLSSGGGESGSTSYFLEHTTGQSTAVGKSTSTNYYNSAGFWYAIPICSTDVESQQIQNLVTWYYQSILDRPPEPGGAEGWTAEIERIQALGIDVKEGFIALGKLFFNSQEYLDMNKLDDEYIIDLYETFLGRTPSPGEVAGWAAELVGGLPRNLLLNYFTFAVEFRGYMEASFGSCPTRPEYTLVNDLYRGFLARLPDDGGFNDWLALMKQAQCAGAETVRNLTHQIALSFIQSAEYAGRNRDNGEYVTDLYDGILRRGAELTGYLAWIAELNAGMTREIVLQHFVSSAEFQGLIDELIAAGCSL